MSQDIQANLKLNLEGLMCPLPVVKVSKAIKEHNNRIYFRIKPDRSLFAISKGREQQQKDNHYCQ